MFVVLLPTAVVLLGCCGLSLYLLNHVRMQDKPEALYWHYESRLEDYAGRLEAGEVIYVEGRGYGIPQYLIDHGARYCTRHGDCFCVSFGFIADSAVPMSLLADHPQVQFNFYRPAIKDVALEMH